MRLKSIKSAKLCLVATAGITLFGGCATQQSNKPTLTPDEVFQGKVTKPISLFLSSLDQDANYSTSKAELTRGIDSEWRLIDTSSKGEVTALQIADWTETVLGDREALPNYLAFDADADGKITAAEFDHRLRIEFNQLDANADNMLDRSELLFALPDPRQLARREPQLAAILRPEERGRDGTEGGRDRRRVSGDPDAR